MSPKISKELAKHRLEQAKESLEEAEILNSELTDDDIEFIQQMALWYFANYDDNIGNNR